MSSSADLEQQIDALLDGDLSPEAFAQLEKQLSEDPAARETYYKRVQLHTLLQADAEDRAAAGDVIPMQPERTDWKPLAAAAAVVIALGASAFSGWFAANKVADSKPAEPTVETDTIATGFGVIAGAADATWAHGDTPARGALIPTGELNLQSGLVKMELFSGVTVMVEGAAQFELLSPMSMRVKHGKVRALVPEGAEGFRVQTAAGELVDLGTEFSVDITPEHADVRVLDGKVEWHPRSADMRLIEEGQAIRWSDEGEAKLPAGGQSIAELESDLTNRRQQRRAAWEQHVQQTRGDDRLLLYYPVLSSGRVLEDASPGGHDARIVRAEPAADRWGTQGAALDLSPTGSRARVHVPGTHRSLTLLCWAKIDGLDRPFNSLFLTDGHEIGEPHWQITGDGRMFFSVKKRDWQGPGGGDKHIFRSPPIWDPSQSGRWMQIATVYDCDTLAVTHYIDGKPVSTEAIPADYLVEQVTIGAASLGNWSEPKHSNDPNFVIRNLNGRIDEFALYGAALTADEIAAHYQIGKP